MKTAQAYGLSAFCGVLALTCASEDSGKDTEGATSSTASTTSGIESGSVTGAPGNTTDEAASDSAPTVASAPTTEPATATVSGSTGEACTFINCDDMARTGYCDNWAQDCPEGQKCAAWAEDGGNAWNSTHCVEVTGTDEPGDECTAEDGLSGVDSCIKGALCWGINQEGIGNCIGLCTGTPEAPVCPHGFCTIGGEGTLNLCLRTCDPLLQNCADPADLCIPNGDDFECAQDAGGAEGQANDPCESANVCDAGLVCLDPATVSAGCDQAALGCCTPFCKFPDGGCPNPDQSCVPWFDPMMLPENAPDLDIGVCAVPA